MVLNEAQYLFKNIDRKWRMQMDRHASAMKKEDKNKDDDLNESEKMSHSKKNSHGKQEDKQLERLFDSEFMKNIVKGDPSVVLSSPSSKMKSLIMSKIYTEQASSLILN